MNTPSTPKPKSTLPKDIGLLIIGALLGLATTLFVEWKNKDDVIKQETTNTARHDTLVSKSDTMNARMAESNRQLSGILSELHGHSTQMTTQTQSLTSALADLGSQFRSPTPDTTLIAKLINGLKTSVGEIITNSQTITQSVDQSKSLAARYEDQLRNTGDLRRILLPRGGKEVVAEPIDGQYYVGVQSEYSEGTNRPYLYVAVDGRQKYMRLGDTAMIHTNADNWIKVTLDKVGQTDYVFGVNHIKR